MNTFSFIFSSAPEGAACLLRCGSSWRGFESHEQILCVHRFANLNQALDELPGDRRINRGLHFHGFDDEQPISFGNTFAYLDQNACHGSGNRSPDMAWLGRIRFWAFELLRF